MAVLRALALAWMVHRTAAVTTTLANCESACNLGEMLCLNKNASSTLCSAVQGACMAGCYASRVGCGCADASVTPCEEINLQAPHANDAREYIRRGNPDNDGEQELARLRAKLYLCAREEARPSIISGGDSLPVGAAVKLTGLSNGAFNGRRGIVAETSSEMRRKGRVKVIVDGRAISVKGENLVVDAPTRSAADAVGELRGRIEDLGLAH